MIEIRWHGRGGQGAKTASQFVGEAALDAGKHIQAFPEYGPERAGAPIRCYTRIDDKPITVHSPITHPQVVVVIDPTLLDAVNVAEGLKEDGIILVNSSEDPKEVKANLKLKAQKVATVDATKISLDTLGIPMPNTPMMGALLKLTPVVSMDTLIEQVKHKFLKKIGEEKTNANIDGIKRAYEEVKIA